MFHAGNGFCQFPRDNLSKKHPLKLVWETNFKSPVAKFSCQKASSSQKKWWNIDVCQTKPAKCWSAVTQKDLDDLDLMRPLNRALRSFPRWHIMWSCRGMRFSKVVWIVKYFDLHSNCPGIFRDFPYGLLLLWSPQDSVQVLRHKLGENEIYWFSD